MGRPEAGRRGTPRAFTLLPQPLCATGARRRRRESAMLRTRNKYCSNCLKTQRFLDLGNCLVCERCSKRLDRAPAMPERTDGAADGRIVAFVERIEPRREAM